MKPLAVKLASAYLLLALMGGGEAPRGATPAAAHFIGDAWGTEQGLPQSSVTSIVQTADGYLWLGTYGGLARFDGVSFTVFHTGNAKGLRSSRILSLCEGRDGTLWIGTERGGLTRYSDNQFITYTTRDGLPSDNVNDIYQDRRGNLWVGTDKALARFSDGVFSVYTGKEGAPFLPVTTLTEDREGALWIGTTVGLTRLRDGRFTTFGMHDGLPYKFVRDLCETRDGRLWVATDGGLVSFLEGRMSPHPHPLKVGSAAALPRRLLEDREGGLWVGTDEGLLRLFEGRPGPYTTNNPLPDKDVKALAADREGNLWVGTNLGGLNRLKAAKVNAYGAKQGLAHANMVPITEDAEGNIWMGLTCGGLARLRGQELTVFTSKDGVPGNCVWSLLADPDGGLLIGTWGGTGLGRYKDGKFTDVTDAHGRHVGHVVLALFRDREGALWVGTDEGLVRYRNGEFTRYRTADGLVSDDVRFIMQDSGGNLWVGTTGGLSRFDGGRFTNYTVENGLAHNFVRAVYEDADGAYWLGTYGGGLHRLKDGRLTHIGTRDGLFDDVVSRILEDDYGNLWMSGNRGLFRASRGELNDFAEGRVGSVTSVSYGTADGMENRECNGGGQPAGWKTRDGRLWFPTIKGAVVVDPARLRKNRLPPPVVIESVLANRRPAERPAQVELPPGGTDLEVNYAGLSFVAPEKVRFRYRLEGYDDWVEAGTRRTAFYTNIPPGRYLFRVIAANDDGVWNTEGATLPVVVGTPFWKTWWFLALATLGVAGLAAFVIRRRVSHLKRAHAAQEAFSRQLIESQEGERKRIAAELHDGIGQSLAIIKNRAALSLTQPENHERALEQLDEIAAAASSAIDEVKEIVSNLHPYQLERLGLTKAVESMLRRAFDPHGIGLTSEIDSLDGLFTKDEEINLYRVVQESVNNIVKHSGASAARATVRRDGHRVLIVIEDDGKGFTPAAAGGVDGARRSFGLVGIAERARMFGGTATISSSPGRGTTVSINIPLRGPSHEQGA